MRRRRVVITGLLLVLGSLSAGPLASASTLCESTLPANINAGLLKQQMIALLERSETFRQQCRRLAAVPHVRVTFVVTSMLPGGGRAETLITRYQAGAIRAWVAVRFSEDYLELIAHELEHVIEQLEGVRLCQQVEAARAWLTQSGAFETQRAIAAGTRARHEFDALTVEAVQPHGVQAPRPRHPVP